MGNILNIKNLSKRYGGRQVLEKVSFTVKPGEVVGLLGPNGAGKTTTFKLILGLEPSDNGECDFGGALDGLPLYKRARMGMGYLPQTPSVFSQLSVNDNLMAVLQMIKKENPQKRCDDLLEKFKLKKIRDQKADVLSGGERRKLEFARALCSDPKIILVDEPFAGVDPIAAEDICGLIENLRDDNIGVLLTDHSVINALSICQRVYLLVDGVIVEEGTPHQIKNSPKAKALYLGNQV